MATPKRTRNPRGSGDVLRAQLLAAAESLLDEHGDPGAVTVRGVASAVGVAPNAVYLHFANRDELLVDAVVARFGTFVETLLEIDRTVDDPVEQLRAGHQAYMTFARANPGTYRAMFGGQSLDPSNTELNDRLIAAALPAFDALLMSVGRCIDAGALPSTTRRTAFARVLFAAEHGWTDMAGTSRGAILPDPDDIFETLMSLAGPPPD